jgi:hypothetical protein
MNQKEAIERMTTLFAELLAGHHGDPMAVDAEDRGRMEELLTCLAENDLRLTNRSPERWIRPTPTRTQNDIGMTTQQIASDVARLEDAQKQNPALLRGSLDSLQDSMLKLDLLLAAHAGPFADAERLSRSTTRGRH